MRGVAPDLAAEMARVLGDSYQAAAFDSPNAGIKALREGAADITFLAPTPERVGLIDFAPAFMEMEVTLIVPGASTIRTLADADQPGRRIVVYEKTANDEMVQKSLTKATIVRVPIFGYKKAFEMIRAGEADGFVDLRDQLMNYVGRTAGRAHRARPLRPQRARDRLRQGTAGRGGIHHGVHRRGDQVGLRHQVDRARRGARRGGAGELGAEPSVDIAPPPRYTRATLERMSCPICG